MLIPPSENRVALTVLIYIGFSFISYPFIAFKYIHYFTYQLVSVLILGIVFLTLALNAKNRIYFDLKIGRPNLVNMTLVAYLLFLCILICSSFLSGSIDSIIDLMKVVVKVVFIIFALVLCPYLWLMRTLSVYSTFVALLSVGALLLFCFQFMVDVQPLGYISLDIVGKDSEERGFYLTGLFWDKAFIKFDGVQSFFRSQSFADEPGTFAFSILPALFYFLYVKRYSLAILLLTTLLTTFSIGAFAAIFLVLVIVFLRNVFVLKKLSVRRIVIITAMVSTILVGAVVVRAVVTDDSVMAYLMTKYDPDAEAGRGSFGVRALGLLTDLEYVKGSALGAGAGGRHSPDRIGLGDVGYFNNLVESGYLGAIFYLSFIAFILIICVKNLVYSDHPLKLLHSKIVFVLMIAGLQRTAIDASLWGGIFLVMLLRTENMFNARRITTNYPLTRLRGGQP